MSQPTSSLRHLTRLYSPTVRQQATRRPLFFRSTAAANVHQILQQSQSRTATARVRAPPTRATLEKVRFHPDDAPDVPFWEKQLRPPIVPAGEVSAVECFRACRLYVALAIGNEPGWRRKYLTTATKSSSSGNNPQDGNGNDDGDISMFTLQYVAVVLIKSNACPAIGIHVLHTGVLLGYAPSILSLARLGLNRDMLDIPQLAPTKEALQALIASSSTSSSSSSSSTSTKSKSKSKSKAHPNNAAKKTAAADDNDLYLADTLTLMGLAHARHGTASDNDRALRFFGLAGLAASASASSGTTGTWLWRADAVIAQAAIHLKRNQRARALEVLGAAMQEMDDADVTYEYARLLDEGDAERWRLMQRAALRRSDKAAREMGRREWRLLEEEEERAREGGKRLSEREKRERRFIADEWLAIAGDKSVP
ncbi:hypothetical protein GGR53DRAFT_186220 [Hypoxylon sp. FL1150]|nr:hypothetical protein GGR53DRAFT_186220 [Hypoxylon sp. FL1150]